ncbi:winged helix-turn-helix transcriptional regulator [Hirschia baltica]|uniref:Transcriptional regulator, HxlR family n=1 Tax=Hirschia baltica (strain ATCC 49814 / DSM 5838 / IFAM 1418) TaxID=582402 RepID=C6XIH6_HIRBI|nr:helix-turn-helix domain-containing protein [Hirschia baltica]ACT60783.1 transcriptional regulator, HxlR family [Hirschia baltica ATCC 49814]
MKWDQLSDDWCPIARATSIVGDRWTLLIVRDCFLGVSKFDDFQKNLGITRHVLAQRLKRLVAVGVLEKKAYQSRPERFDYMLTERGKELGHVLEALRLWGREHLSIRRQAGIGETIDE